MWMLSNHNSAAEYARLLDWYMVPEFRRSFLSPSSLNIMPYILLYRCQLLEGNVWIFSEAIEDGCIQFLWKIASFVSIYKASRPRSRETALITAWNADLIKTKDKVAFMRIWWPVKVWVVWGNVHTLWCRALSACVCRRYGHVWCGSSLHFTLTKQYKPCVNLQRSAKGNKIRGNLFDIKEPQDNYIIIK
jgi:hypothetical protein